MAAARHGVPAAAFAVGGIPQWLHDGVNGHLAPASPPTREGLADAIVRCLSDPSHYEDLAAGARQAAAMFTMDRHLPELMRILEAVAGQRRLIA
jgi:glycosyltransferase involved in cell wall biosynthesis